MNFRNCQSINTEWPACRGSASFRQPVEHYVLDRRSAFTLLEVMVALGIFFMAMFAILALVSNTLHNARALQESDVDAGSLAAQLMLTNKLYEGNYSGDFGDAYPNYTWDRTDTPITNGLWQCDFVVHHRRGRVEVDTPMSIFVFSPDSQATSGGGFRR